MDKELIGYTCLFCRKYNEDNLDLLADTICYFGKDEARNGPAGTFFPCKDGSSDHIDYDPEYVIEAYKKIQEGINIYD